MEKFKRRISASHKKCQNQKWASRQVNKKVAFLRRNVVSSASFKKQEVNKIVVILFIEH